MPVLNAQHGLHLSVPKMSLFYWEKIINFTVQERPSQTYKQFQFDVLTFVECNIYLNTTSDNPSETKAANSCGEFLKANRQLSNLLDGCN